MKIVFLAALAAVAACSAGCSHQNIAQKALGDDAIKVTSSPTQDAYPPGIYKITKANPRRGVTLSPVCTKDFLKQNALKVLTTNTRNTDATIEDDNLAKNITLTLPKWGIGPATVEGSVTPLVTVDRATKYNVVSLDAKYSGSLADYIIANVANKCSKSVLHGDLIFVSASANAVNLSRVTSGGGSLTGSVLGVEGKLTGNAANEEKLGPATFGVAGEHRNIP